jgi:hypothetical protein
MSHNHEDHDTSKPFHNPIFHQFAMTVSGVNEAEIDAAIESALTARVLNPEDWVIVEKQMAETDVMSPDGSTVVKILQARVLAMNYIDRTPW